MTASPRRRRRPPLRWLWITATALVAAFALVVVAGIPVYVAPPRADVDRADLIYVIGPPTTPRVKMAKKLRADGVADRILISVSGTTEARRLGICEDDGVTCARATPFTTKGEADLLTDYVRTHPEVTRTIVLTFTPHVSRTRFIFAKCFAGDVAVAEVPVRLSLADWAYQYVYQTAGFVKAAIQGCPGSGPGLRGS